MMIRPMLLQVRIVFLLSRGSEWKETKEWLLGYWQSSVFFISVLVTWLYLVCKNSLNCAFLICPLHMHVILQRKVKIKGI